MNSPRYVVQEKTPFAESLIWQINTDFYNQKGMTAWTEGIVPHEITNSSLAATTYAELIYAFLKDLELNDKTKETVYILELGAGHGKLCYNVLKHLDELIAVDKEISTRYCYILSDIVEDNISFWSHHPKLQGYYDRGLLDLSYFDATKSKTINLVKSQKTISTADLDQPILTIANYFFDSLPNELFYFHDNEMYSCSVSADSATDPLGKSAQDLIGGMELTYHTTLANDHVFKNEIFNEILTQYNQIKGDSYILFPKAGLECIANIATLSKQGLVLLTMDKGYKEIQELEGRPKPDLVKHGSFSFWVNFHAISQFCIKNGGRSMFDASTNLSIELGCLLFMKNPSKYILFEQMYRKHSKQINLDDFNSIKNFVYRNMASINLPELLGLVRLSSYDSTIFINLLPTIKKLSKSISIKQRSRLKQTVDYVWDIYYAVNEEYDLSYELAGLMYDLGYYNAALGYFKSSSDSFGYKIDVDYNQILCYYQLRQDEQFYKALKESKLRFPDAEAFLNLDKLDMA